MTGRSEGHKPRSPVIAAREAVAVADLSARRDWLRIGGQDRVAFLQGLVTNDVAAAAPGVGLEACLLNPQGRVRYYFDLWVRADDVLLATEAGSGEGLREALDLYIITQDVAVTSAPTPSFAALGPGAARWLLERAGEATGMDAAGWELVEALEPSRFHQAGDVLVAPALAQLGASGWVVVGAQLPAELRAPELTAADLESLRIEAGIPRASAEMAQPILPQEAGLAERAVSFKKGCYVGQEPVAMLRFRGKQRRRLLGLVLDPGDGALPVPEASLLLGQSPAAAKNVGRVTSAAWSPTLDRRIAMGIVKLAAHETGTRVWVQTPDGPVGAEVRGLPLVP